MTSHAACVSTSPGAFLHPPEPGPPIVHNLTIACAWTMNLVMSQWLGRLLITVRARGRAKELKAVNYLVLVSISAARFQKTGLSITN